MRVLFAAAGLLASLTMGACATAEPSNAIQTVGVRSALITDDGRRDSLDATHPRQWMIDVYYAARSQPPAASDVYARDPTLLATMIQQNYYEVGEAALQSWAHTPAPAIANAPPLRGSHPTILLSPGSGTAAFNYSQLAADLVRRGYTVVVVDEPYVGIERLPDGRLLDSGADQLQQSEDPNALTPRILEWSADLSVVLDRLADPHFRAEIGHLNLDLEHVIAVGHSTGGAIALDACAVEARIDACADFEGGLFGSRAETQGVAKPLFITGSRARGRPRTAGMGEDMLSAVGRSGNRSAWYVKVTGGSHMSFSDAPAMMPTTLSRFGGELMSPERSSEVYGGMLDAFARAYVLGGHGDADFAALLASLPEAEYLSTGGRRSPERG